MIVNSEYGIYLTYNESPIDSHLVVEGVQWLAESQSIFGDDYAFYVKNIMLNQFYQGPEYEYYMNIDVCIILNNNRYYCTIKNNITDFILTLYRPTYLDYNVDCAY